MIHVATLEDLGELMTQLRAKSGEPLRAMAKTAHISTGTLLRIEKGRGWPRLSTVGWLLQYYCETATIGWNPDGTGGSGNDYVYKEGHKRP